LQKGMDPLLLQVGQGTAAPGQELIPGERVRFSVRHGILIVGV
jgi:hypothetical protein